MNREFLENLGLEKEAIDKVMAEYGKSINAYKEKAEKVDSLQSQIEDYKQQLQSRDEQLEELKKIDAEGLQAKIQELQEANQKAEQEWQEKLQKQQFEFALKDALVAAKVRNPKAVKALLDTEVIKLDGDKLLGLEEQLNSIKESDPYLFEEEKTEETPKPSFTTGQHQTSGHNNDPFAAKLAKYQ